MTSTEITNHGQGVFRMERHRAKGARIDTGKTSLALLDVNRDSTDLLVPFKGIVFARLDAFACLALAAYDNFRLPSLGGGENADSRLFQAIASLLGRGTGQLAKLASGASFFRYLEFHAFSGNPVCSHFRSFR